MKGPSRPMVQPAPASTTVHGSCTAPRREVSVRMRSHWPALLLALATCLKQPSATAKTHAEVGECIVLQCQTLVSTHRKFYSQSISGATC